MAHLLKHRWVFGASAVYQKFLGFRNSRATHDTSVLLAHLVRRDFRCHCILKGIQG
jgi:hypothetical protein